MPGNAFDSVNSQGKVKGHTVTDDCPFCGADTKLTTFTIDYKNQVEYYTCENA